MSDRLLLCTDLDRTLLPNGEAPESPGVRKIFRRMVTDPRITLAYVTGRGTGLVNAALAEYELPLPDYLIGDVGTTIAEPDRETWKRWPSWDAVIGVDWPDRNIDVRDMVGEIRGLELQDESRQSRFKVSFHAALPADSSVLTGTVRARLAAAGVAANVVWSVDEVAQVGLLDILPRRANKRLAIEFLMNQLGFELKETLFAGDSGNDLPVLVSPIPSVVVANATEELKQRASRDALRAGLADALYLAKGSGSGRNGNYGAGIFEGIEHFHPGMLEVISEEGA